MIKKGMSLMMFFQTVLHYVLRKAAKDGAVALDSHRSVEDGGGGAPSSGGGLRKYTNFEKIRQTEMNYRRCFEVLTCTGEGDDGESLRDSDSRYARQIR